jgi:hypothetical protein
MAQAEVATMKQFLNVQNSDGVNRYNMMFALSALTSALDVSWDPGVPTHMSHDLHRMIGWSRAFGIHLEPGLARLTGLLYLPENDQERSQLAGLADRHWNEQLNRRVRPHLAELEHRLRPHLSGRQQPCQADCAAIIDPGLAARAFPEIFSLRDKDGLVPLTALTPIAPGVFEQYGLLLFAHPYFRRSLSRRNSVNRPFLACFQALRDDSGRIRRIALDEDMVGLAATFHEHFELAYWWGPKFTNDLEKIPAGITRHEANDTDRRFHGISHTEFRWYTQAGAKTFECEELQDRPSAGAGVDLFGCRFVHSRVDPGQALPIHLDGAIRMYDEEQMVQRLGCDIYHAGRRSKYTKLWRLDGPVPIPTWKELIAHFYRDNKLVGEYFEGVDGRTAASPPSAPPSADRPQRSFAPTTMERGDGVRIHVCYLDRPQEARPPLGIHVLDKLSSGDQRFEYVESHGLELVKMLRRAGHKVALPDHVVRLKFQDRAVNQPLVTLAGNRAVALAKETLTAIRDLCNAWTQRDGDRLVSFGLRIDYGARDVILSVAGHVDDVGQWMSWPDAELPDASDGWAAWLDRIYTKLNTTFPAAGNLPPLDELLETSGLLHFQRKALAPDQYSVRLGGVDVVMDGGLPAEDKTLIHSLMANGTLGVGACMLIERSRCSRCREAYECCGCIKGVDHDVRQVIENYSIIGAFWTDRAA